MSPSLLDTYLASMRSGGTTTPALIDEESIFRLISGYTGYHITSYSDIYSGNFPHIQIYDIPEDKKEFNIETVRRCIGDIGLQPYSGKIIFILRHFDTATIQAQNALLKCLEECPIYAIIFLETPNAYTLLDTIVSRCINLVHTPTLSSDGEKIAMIQEYYKKGSHLQLASTLYGLKCSQEEAINILRGVYQYTSGEKMQQCIHCIEILSSTHENPRSILDLFFFS